MKLLKKISALTFSPIALSLLAINAQAGGLLLTEVATFDSVSSAGVGNSMNRTGASAAVTSPAGLTSVEDTSLSAGLQYIDAGFKLNGDIDGKEHSTKGTNQQFAPSMAYAKRVNEKWVVAGSLHGEGGLAMEYNDGLNGRGVVDSLALNVINTHLAAAYQATDALSLGAGLIVQNVSAKAEIKAGNIGIEGEGESVDTGFMLSAMYDINDTTYVSANYKSQIDHDYDLELDRAVGGASDIAKNVSWPAMVDIGLSHQLNDNTTLKLRAGYENWEDYGKADGKDMDNSYSLGMAVNYKNADWTYQAGVRYDSAAMTVESMTPDLAVGEQWQLGLGAEKTLTSGSRIGLAYEYRHMGNPEVKFEQPVGETFEGEFSDNRLHFVTLSYTY